MNCPNCNNENTQKLSIIYSSGLTELDMSSVGMGISGGGGAIGGASTSGTGQTALSKLSSPPKKFSYTKLILVSVIVTFLGVVFLESISVTLELIWVTVSIAGTAWLLRLAWRFNTKIYPKEYKEWDQKFMCLRCATVFKVKESNNQLNSDA